MGNTAYVSGIVTSSTLNPTAVGNSFAVKVYENEFALDQMGAVGVLAVYLPGVALNPGFQGFYDNIFLPSVGGPRDLVDGKVKIEVQ